MDDPWMVSTRGRPRPGADVGEGVDGLHYARVGGVVKGVDPVADLVDDVDLPFARRHPRSVPIAILTRRRPGMIGGPGGSPGSGAGSVIDLIVGWTQRTSETSRAFSTSGRHETGAGRRELAGDGRARSYLLSGLVRCGLCGRRMDS
jgi:hypothetical protein